MKRKGGSAAPAKRRCCALRGAHVSAATRTSVDKKGVLTIEFLSSERQAAARPEGEGSWQEESGEWGGWGGGWSGGWSGGGGAGSWFDWDDEKEGGGEETEQKDDSDYDDWLGQPVAAEPKKVRYTSVPYDNILFPPHSSGDPHQALFLMRPADYVTASANCSVLVLRGALTGFGARMTSATGWSTLWNCEEGKPVRLTVSQEPADPAVALPQPPPHPLLGELPTAADMEWALAQAGSQLLSRRGAAVLICGADASPLAQFLRVSHPRRRPRSLVTGPILDRLAAGAGAGTPHLEILPKLQRLGEALSARAASPPVVLVVGGRDMGKSTVCRYLSNSMLSGGWDRVAWLDFDAGQSEFSPSGVLGLYSVSTFLFGPTYTHLAAHVDGVQTIRQCFIGDTSPERAPLSWVGAALDAISAYQERCPELPLLVNTHGWTRGTGLRCTTEIASRLRPTHLVDVGLEAGDDVRGWPESVLRGPSAGICSTYQRHFGDHRGYAPAPAPADENPHPTTVVQLPPHPGRTVGGRHGSGKSGWWSRHAALAVYIANGFNEWAEKQHDLREDAEENTRRGWMRHYLASAIPLSVSLRSVVLCLTGGGDSWGVTPHRLAARLTNKQVGLFASTGPYDDSCVGGSVRFSRVSPHCSPERKYELVGLGVVVAADDETLHVLTPLDCVSVQRVVCVAAGVTEPPKYWRHADEARTGTNVIGRGVLAPRGDRLDKHRSQQWL